MNLMRRLLPSLLLLFGAACIVYGTWFFGAWGAVAGCFVGGLFIGVRDTVRDRQATRQP